MKTVYVSGASGWIGGYCCKHLNSRGFEIVNEWDNCEYMLYLSWYTEHGKFWESPINVECFLEGISALQYFFDKDGRRAVFAGTCAEGGPTLYGRSKDGLRKITEIYSNITGKEIAWCRIFYPYGPGEKPERLIPSAIIAFLRGEKFRIKNPSEMVDPIYIDDVAQAFVSILDSHGTGTFDIGSGQPTTVLRIMQMICEEMDCLHLLEWDENPHYKIMRADPTRLMTYTNYMEPINLKRGLKETIQWWKENYSLER